MEDKRKNNSNDYDFNLFSGENKQHSKSTSSERTVFATSQKRTGQSRSSKVGYASIQHNNKRKHLARRQSRGHAIKRQIILCGECFTVILLIAFLVVLLIKTCSSKSPLKGKWNLDGITKYEFYDDVKGAMVLPSSIYEFTYKIEENKVIIDFVAENANDAEYEFSVDGKTLTLTGGNKATQGIYKLTKEKD